MTLVLRPNLSAQSAMPITMLAALAVRDAISQIAGMEAMIKWPNDILLNGKKVAGILTELSVSSDGQVKWIVVGIGVNVNTRFSDFPEEVQDIATSLYCERGLECSRLELVRAICYQMETLYGDFIASGGDAKIFLPRYKIYSATLLRRVEMYAGQQKVEGVAEDFDDSGALLIRTDDGKLTRMFTGEVTSHPTAPEKETNETDDDTEGDAQ